jgi:membrane protein YqaA with SNARE-associated domain
LLHKITQALIAYGPLGLLVISFIDSLGIPVAALMDVLLIGIAVDNATRGWWAAALAVIGSTAGTVVLFLAAQQGGKRFHLKAEQPGRTRRFRAWFRRYGLLTVFVPALMPIPMPLKLFVVSAGVMRTRPRNFVAVLLAARILRYFSEAWLGVALGKASQSFLKSHAWHFGIVSIALFVTLYLAVRIISKGVDAEEANDPLES